MRMNPFPSSDAKLVRQALRDRAAAFEGLVRRYQKKVYAVVRANGVRGDGVDDVVQEVFLRGFRRLPSLRDPTSFGPWLLAIARNTARSEVSKLGRASVGGDHVEQLAAATDPDRLEASELRDVVWTRVEELPPSVREVIFLYYQDGASVREIARALGIQAGAVKARLHKGRALLRERLWRELETSLRDMLPSTREWRRRGRALTLVAISTLTAEWLARAKVAAALAPPVAAAAVAAAGTPSGSAQVFGGTVVLSKKTVMAVSVSLIALVAGGSWVWNQRPPELESDRAGDVVDDAMTARHSVEPGTRSSSPVSVSEKARPRRASETANHTEMVEPLVRGEVVDLEGRGVSGARVIALELQAWRAIGKEFRAQPVPLGELRQEYRAFAPTDEVQTDVEGRFRFDRLAAGTYRLLVQKDHFLLHTVSECKVTKAEPARLSIELVRAMPIRGRVVDAVGAPVSGVKLTAEPQEFHALDDVESTLHRLARWERGEVLIEGPFSSHLDGSFTIESLEPGVYTIEARSTNLPPVTLQHVAAGREDLVVTLGGGTELRGQVVSAVDGEELEGVEVRLTAAVGFEIERLRSRPVNAPPDEPLFVEKTDSNGRFRMSGLADGAFVVEVRAEGYPRLEREVQVGNLRGEPTIAPRRENASSIQELEVFEIPEAKAIRGRVVSADGMPIEDIRVSIATDRHGTWLSNAGVVAVEAKSDASGRFALESLRDGVYELHFSSPEWMDVKQHLRSGSSELTVTLQRGYRLHGRVIDAGGEAVAGAQLRFQKEAGVSDGDGHFDLRGIPTTATGKHTLRASHARYGTASLRVEVPRAEDAPIVLALAPLDQVLGVILDPNGEPVEGAVVRLDTRGPSGTPIAMGTRRWATSDAEGRFQLAGEAQQLAASSRRTFVVAQHDGFAPSFVGPLIPPASDAAWAFVELELERGIALEGSVRDTKGRALAGARVEVRSAIPESDGFRAAFLAPPRRGWTDAGGSYRLEHIAVGLTELRVSAPGHAPRIQRREVADGVRIDVVLEAGVSLSGEVVDADGRPFPNAEVLATWLAEDPSDHEKRLLDKLSSENAVRGEDSAEKLHRRAALPASKLSGPDGRFEFRHLLSGKYLVWARAPGFVTTHRFVERDALERDVEPLVLERFAAVSGSVIDAVTKLPVQSFKVELARREPEELEDSDPWCVDSAPAAIPTASEPSTTGRLRDPTCLMACARATTGCGSARGGTCTSRRRSPWSGAGSWRRIFHSAPVRSSKDGWSIPRVVPSAERWWESISTRLWASRFGPTTTEDSPVADCGPVRHPFERGGITTDSMGAVTISCSKTGRSTS